MLGPCGRQLVEYKGKMVSVCSPDYALRNQPALKPVFGLVMFIVLLVVSFIVFKILKNTYSKYKLGEAKFRSFIAPGLLILITLYYSISWLAYAISKFGM